MEWIGGGKGIVSGRGVDVAWSGTELNEEEEEGGGGKEGRGEEGGGEGGGEDGKEEARMGERTLAPRVNNKNMNIPSDI